jgi:cell pole-organizing protein PopZ
MSGQGNQPPGGPPDQSMEDILASIRRILNEDDAPVADAAPPADAEPLLLTEEMLVPAPEEAPPPEVAVAPLTPPEVADAQPSPPAEEPALPEPAAAAPAEPPPVPPPAPAEPPPAPRAAVEELLAPAVAAAAAASVGQLLRAVSTERTAQVSRGGPSIEDVVREELRPLLKDWLDQHLPGIVERLVRAEIERVVGRALS